MTTSIVVSDIGSVLDIVSMLAKAASIAVPGAALAGWTLDEIGGLAKGLASAIPDAVAVVDEMTAIRNGGGEATPEQRAAWRARAASIHAAIQAA